MSAPIFQAFPIPISAAHEMLFSIAHAMDSIHESLGSLSGMIRNADFEIDDFASVADEIDDALDLVRDFTIRAQYVAENVQRAEPDTIAPVMVARKRKQARK